MPYKIDFVDGDALAWTLTDDGATVESDPDWTPTFYVHHDDPAVLDEIRPHVAALPDVELTVRERHRPGFRHEAEPVLRVDTTDLDALHARAHDVWGWREPGELTCWNVDLSPEFRYCLETARSPVPPRELRTLELERPDGPDAPTVDELRIGEATVQGEAAAIDHLVRRLEREDPDVLFLGSASLIPRLYEAAERHDHPDFDLGRGEGYQQRAGRSTYESYGRTGHSPARYNVPGRVIINAGNTFFWDQTNLDGCLDLVGRSWKPLQELAWASIGNVLTAIQVREARERDVLVPWHSWRHEFFKPASTLHDADRGGFTFAPDVGLHEEVHELDFSSLYPNIIVTRNVSPETTRCGCCDGKDVPGLGYSICEERGYLADVLQPIIEDRDRIKQGLRACDDPARREELEGRSSALKWILVSCFGYQGFSNAKFGRIECHESINAFARELLLDAKECLEAGGWRVVHGIVDSLWVTPMDDRKQADLDDLAATITDELGIDLEYAAGYDWLALVPRRNDDAGALTKYFGRKRSEDLGAGAAPYKLRGIEARQRSTTPLVEQVQRELIEVLDEERRPEAVCDRLQRWLGRLRRGSVAASDLVLTQRVSKPLEQYQSRTRTVAALQRAERCGLSVHPGESISYVVVDDSKRSHERVRLAFEVDKGTPYDKRFHRGRLLRAAESILSPLGWRRADIESYLDGSKDVSLGAFG
jgi:DNA polymerase I